MDAGAKVYIHAAPPKGHSFRLDPLQYRQNSLNNQPNH